MLNDNLNKLQKSQELTKRVEKKRKLFRGISIVGLFLPIVYVIIQTIPTYFKLVSMLNENASVAIIGGADGPTSIFVAHKSINIIGIIIVLAILFISICGLYLTRRK